jgi:hypothetical protein
MKQEEIQMREAKRFTSADSMWAGSENSGHSLETIRTSIINLKPIAK